MTPRRIPAVDGFRGYAILGIVSLHVGIGLGLILQGKGGALQTLAYGTLGNVVDAFFIVSGFALFHQLISRGGATGGAGRFYRRRFIRIYPAYWLSLVVVLIALAFYLPGSATFPTLGSIAVHFSGLQMPAQLIDGSLLIGFGVNGVIWFVSVIIGFYLVFPLIARPYSRHPLIGLLAAALISIAWKESAAHMTSFWSSIQTDHAVRPYTRSLLADQFPGWAFSFGAGMTAAWAYHRLMAARSRADLERAALVAAPFALAALAVAFYLFGHRGVGIAAPIGPTIDRESALVPIAWTAAVTAGMLVVLIGPPWMRQPFENRPIRWLGDLSYGIFLIHFAIVTYLVSLFPGWTTDPGPVAAALFFATVLGGAIAYSLASRRFVEVPASQWAARRRTSAGLTLRRQ